MLQFHLGVPIQPGGWSCLGTLGHPGGVLYLQDTALGTLLRGDAWGSLDLNGQFVAICSHSTSISSLFSHYLLIALQLQDVVKIILHFFKPKTPLSKRDACRAVEIEIFCMVL